ncbi:Hypothetical predicted protein [Mytilus galloprovincialis]|uniref:Uncharacterized protein n=1 Tax=Mytilus galloprovincialis TaxID=29158 RepID=A0A8B6ERL9_MYTGA|nr:Hypothetical predicted protein [Mytilus galloprovincialis]
MLFILNPNPNLAARSNRMPRGKGERVLPNRAVRRQNQIQLPVNRRLRPKRAEIVRQNIAIPQQPLIPPQQPLIPPQPLMPPQQPLMPPQQPLMPPQQPLMPPHQLLPPHQL